MTNLIKISAEGQETIMVDANKINFVELHTRGKNDEKRILILTADKYEDSVSINLDDCDVDIPELVEKIRAAGNDLIEMTSSRGVDEKRKVYKEYISPKAIAYLQAEENKSRHRGLSIRVGVKVAGRKGYGGQTEETFNKLRDAFVNNAGENVKVIPANKAITGFNQGTDFYIDAREITRISVNDSVHARIDMKNVGHLTFETKTSKIAYDFECAVKRYMLNPDNPLPQQSYDALNDEMRFATSDSADSLVVVTRALANEVKGMVEIPSFEPDLNSPNPHFLYARSSFVRPADVVSVDTYDSPDRKEGVYNYYCINLELSKETGGMMGQIRMDYPTPEERDEALAVYMQRCEDLKKKPQNKPAPKTRQTGKYKF